MLHDHPNIGRINNRTWIQCLGNKECHFGTRFSDYCNFPTGHELNAP